jgi:hypothetical protein
LMQIDAQIKIGGCSLRLDNKQKVRDFIGDLLKERPFREDSLYRFLQFWSEESSKPLVLFIDEIDGLIEDTLVSLLKQFRTGYEDRPTYFPQSICLIGVRDLRDYKVRSQEEEQLNVLVSPFNIIATSLRLGDFSQSQVRDLYLQHTQATGQVFTDEAMECAYYLTQGQPWLVNALGYLACFSKGADRSKPITQEVIETAKEKLILRRAVHFDTILGRLNDKRVRSVIDPIISGSTELIPYDTNDLQYVCDLGLIKQDSIEIANPIYREIIPRVLVRDTQKAIHKLYPNTTWYLNRDHSLNMSELLKNFTQFFRENSQAWGMQFQYQESMPHLLLMAFLQRVVNGGGTICREYALGRKRVDLLVLWQQQCFVIELKVKHGEETLAQGLDQTTQYMDTVNATEGHLVIFDRDPTKSWDDKISSEVLTFHDRKIHVWTM